MFNSTIEEALNLDSLGACWLFKIKDILEINEIINVWEAVQILGIKTRKRNAEIVARRRWFWYFMKQKYNSLTFGFIGTMTGHDHSTVLKAIEEIEENTHYRKVIEIYRGGVHNIVKNVKI